MQPTGVGPSPPRQGDAPLCQVPGCPRGARGDAPTAERPDLQPSACGGGARERPGREGWTLAQPGLPVGGVPSPDGRRPRGHKHPSSRQRLSGGRARTSGCPAPCAPRG